MDQLMKSILKHSEDHTYAALAEAIQSNAELLGKQDVQSLDSVIDALDASKQSLGVLAVL